MKKWEYKVTAIDVPVNALPDLCTPLEWFGRNGWELVSIVKYERQLVFFMKRPIATKRRRLST